MTRPNLKLKTWTALAAASVAASALWWAGPAAAQDEE